VIAEKP